jgi:hypothetical protein
LLRVFYHAAAARALLEKVALFVVLFMQRGLNFTIGKENSKSDQKITYKYFINPKNEMYLQLERVHSSVHCSSKINGYLDKWINR